MPRVTACSGAIALVLASLPACSSGSDGAPSADGEDASGDPVDTTVPGDDTGTVAVDTGAIDTRPDADAAPTCGGAASACKVGGDCCSGLRCIYGKCQTCTDPYPDYCAVPGRTDGGCFPKGTACSTVVSCPGSSARGCASTEMKYDCTTKTCVCTNPSYPNFCKGHDTVPDSCWPSTTACSTTTACTDGTLHACRSAVLKYDCTTATCTCPSASYPNYCKAHDAVPEGCWPSTTACSTTTKCADGTQHACRSSSFTYDCTTGTCKCANPSYPVYCPALGDVVASCWSTGTVCSSVANCSGTYKACTTAGYHYDCSTSSCVSDGGGTTGGSTSCDPSSCKSYSDCVPGYGCMTCFQWCEGSVCHDGGCSDPF